MNAKALSILALLVLALSAIAMAEESPAYNLMVSDQDVPLIEGFTQVRIYAIDPETDKRLDAKPVASLTDPANPIKLWLDPGHYEFVVLVSFIAEEVTYFRFEIVEDERTLVDLMRVEIPKEFDIEEPETR
jgi:hypothetical protein